MLQEFCAAMIPDDRMFQQNGSPPHVARTLKTYLNDTFPGSGLTEQFL